MAQATTEFIWHPDEETLDRANVVRLMRRYGLSTPSRTHTASSVSHLAARSGCLFTLLFAVRGMCSTTRT